METLAITLVVGVVSILITFLLYQKTTKNQKKIQTLISKITGLFAASQKVGIVTAYENRKSALSKDGDNIDEEQPFVSRLENEKKLIVVGSSLLGLRHNVPHLDRIILGRESLGYESKFMLTHPCFSGLRESQENRAPGQIKKEIEEMESFLESLKVDLDKCLRFYRGTPTCFLIITSEAMLVNPYPYQIEAFNSFCLEVRRLPQNKFGILFNKNSKMGENNKTKEIPPQIDPRFNDEFLNLMHRGEQKEYDYRLNLGSDIYAQFYWYHYLLPWFSLKAVTYSEFQSQCKSCKGLDEGYKPDVCTLIAKDKIIIKDDEVQVQPTD